MPDATVETGIDSEDLSIPALLEEWLLIEFDFQHILRIDLEYSTHSMSWRRFSLLLAGLFGAEKSVVRQHFRPDKKDDDSQAQSDEDNEE